MEDYNKEKSILRNRHLQEEKPLEKELKKKKGAQRAATEAKLSQVRAKHEDELDRLAKKFDVKVTAKHSTPSQLGVTLKEKEEDTPPHHEHYFSNRDWKSLSKKQLEAEAHTRGLGKSGSREDLVMKLLLFSATQEKMVEEGKLSVTAVPPKFSAKTAVVLENDNEDEDDVNDETSHPSKPKVHSGASKFLSNRTDGGADSAAAISAKKHAAPAAKAYKAVDKPRLTSSSSSDSSSGDDSSDSSDSDDDSSAELDIPDSQKVLGSGRQHGRAASRRQHNYEHRSLRGRKNGPVGKQSEAAASPTEEAEAEMKQARVVKVMQGVLKKILEHYPNGIAINRVLPEIEKMKVKNFTPESVGYDSVEEWLRNQPPKVLQYRASKGRIMPPVTTIMPENSDHGGDDAGC